MLINSLLSSGELTVAMAAITRALLCFHSESHRLLPDGAWVSAGCRERTRGIRVLVRNPFRRDDLASIDGRDGLRAGPAGGSSEPTAREARHRLGLSVE
jgi:hypothetical protein